MVRTGSFTPGRAPGLSRHKAASMRIVAADVERVVDSSLDGRRVKRVAPDFHTPACNATSAAIYSRVPGARPSMA